MASALCVFLGVSCTANMAQAATAIITPPATTTTSGNNDTQDRVGLLLNVPFDGTGFKFADAIISLAYQNGQVSGSGNVSGWQVAIGTRLTKFTPMFSASALAGERCTYGTAGVSYGDGKWGLPVFIHASHLQLGLTNAGGFGGIQLGASSLECFKRFVPNSTPAPVAPTLPPSGGEA